MAHILVIDDDLLIRRTVSRILTRKDHIVTEASDGLEGMQKFEEIRPDLIITDILMPNQEGIETIRQLRAVAPDVRIIAMSGSAMPGDMMYLNFAKSFGADETLSKPFRNDELIALVDQLLANR